MLDSSLRSGTITRGRVRVASGSPLFILGGASLVGMSKGSEKVIELLSSKYSWIGFLNKDILLSREEK
jgi:hypothetical protein